MTHAERVYHSVASSPYCLPSDEAERQRLIRQHFALKKFAGHGELLASPLEIPEDAFVLDSGTGSGVWALDFSKQVSLSVTIYAIDIETRLFPSERPPNVIFNAGSVLRLSPSWTAKFSLIHQRLLLYALRLPDWVTALSEMFRCTKPGGTVQLTEVITPPNSSAGPCNRKWAAVLEAFCASRGLVLHCARILPDLLKAAGFEDITTYETGVILGSKGGDAGMEVRRSRIGAFRGMKLPILNAGGFGVISSGDAFDELLDDVEREWEETGLAEAGYVHIVARHPLDAVASPNNAVGGSALAVVSSFHAIVRTALYNLAGYDRN